MPPLERATGVCRNECERRDIRPSEGLDDESRSLTREPSLAPLFPRLNKPPCACVVDDRGSGARKRQPPPAALHATPDRPGAGRAAASAERRRESDQRVATAETERRPGQLTGGTTVRQEDVEQHTFDATSAIRHESVNESCRLTKSRAGTRLARADPAGGGAGCRRPAAAPCRRCRATCRQTGTRRPARARAARR